MSVCCDNESKEYDLLETLSINELPIINAFPENSIIYLPDGIKEPVDYELPINSLSMDDKIKE